MKYSLQAASSLQIFIIVFIALCLSNIVSINLQKRNIIDTYQQYVNHVTACGLKKCDSSLSISILKSCLLEQLQSFNLPFDCNVDVLSQGELAVQGSHLEIESAIRRTLTENRNILIFHGRLWGLFWNQPHYLYVFIPVQKNNIMVLSFSMKAIYRTLMQTQKIWLLYAALTLSILTVAGFAMQYRSLIMPFRRLIKQIEKYQDNPLFILTDDAHKGAIARLFAGIKNIIERYENGKLELEQNVVSLNAANQTIKDTQNKLIHLEKLACIGQLSAGIAHEIGNPLSIVTGYMDMLKDRLDGDPIIKDCLYRSQYELKKIDRIIVQLLDISRSHHAVRMEYIDAHWVIDEVISLFKMHPKCKNIELILSLDAADAFISADPDFLQQVLLNLLINAADSYDNSPNATHHTIHVNTLNCCKQLNGEKRYLLQIEIIDCGIGIAAEYLTKIFDPFFTTKQVGQGTGLGLSVSHALVSAMNGELNIFSQNGHGTQAILLFPGNA